MATYSDSSGKMYHAPPPYYPNVQLPETQANSNAVSSTIGYQSIPSAPPFAEQETRTDESRRQNHLVLITLIIAVTVIVMTVIISGTIVFLRHYPGVTTTMTTTTTTTTTTPKPICFDGDGFVVQSDSSQKKIRDLKIGDHILVGSNITNGQIKLHYSPVIAIDVFQTYDNQSPIDYLQIQTHSNATRNTLHITPRHLLLVRKETQRQPRFYFASEINIGDHLYLSIDARHFASEAKVIHIKQIVHYDAYAPLTMEGTLVVNNILTSCYGTYSHRFVHWLMLPRRWLLYYNFKTITRLLDSEFITENMELVRDYLMKIDVFRLSSRRYFVNFIDLIKHSFDIISINI